MEVQHIFVVFLFYWAESVECSECMADKTINLADLEGGGVEILSYAFVYTFKFNVRHLRCVGLAYKAKYCAVFSSSPNLVCVFWVYF